MVFQGYKIKIYIGNNDINYRFKNKSRKYYGAKQNGDYYDEIDWAAI